MNEISKCSSTEEFLRKILAEITKSLNFEVPPQ
jgi:hypothetical protein